MKKYKYERYFTFENHRYKVVGDTLDEVCEKKAKKLEELKKKSTILSPSTTVDQWAEIAFKTYKSHVKGLKEMKLRYYKYVSPVIGFIPISKVRAIQCQNILNECNNMSFSHVTKLRMEIKFLFSSTYIYIKRLNNASIDIYFSLFNNADNQIYFAEGVVVVALRQRTEAVASS